MKVKVMSREMVKPSSPTTDSLKIHKLSSIDHCTPSIYLPMLLFFKNPEEEVKRRSQLLKHSLSHLLTFFNPFAGTLNTGTDEAVWSVICDDHGVPFTEADADGTLADFLQLSDLHFRVWDLIPEDVMIHGTTSCPDLAAVQVTRFSCGGVAISTSVNHLVADAHSVSFFVRSWAAMYRERSLPKPPLFNASAHFPPAAEGKTASSPTDHFAKQARPGLRRLVYGPEAVRALKEKASAAGVANPTRVEVVTAHLTGCITSARSGGGAAVVSHAVDLRSRGRVFPEELIGNLQWNSVIIQRPPLITDSLVKQLRGQKAKLEGFGLLIRALPAETLSEELRKLYSGAAPASDDLIFFSSWCNIGHYDIDFGWGEPVWVALVWDPPIGKPVMFVNVVLLLDTKTRDGVEAYLFLDEQHLTLLETSQDLLAYAAFDQTPLHYS